MRDRERFEHALPLKRCDSPAPTGIQVIGKSTPRHRSADGPANGFDAASTLRVDAPSTLSLRALAEAPRAGKSRQSQHVIRMPMGEGDDARAEDVRSERQRQALAGVDEQLQRLMPEPVRVERAAVAAQDRRDSRLTLSIGWRCDAAALRGREGTSWLLPHVSIGCA